MNMFLAKDQLVAIHPTAGVRGTRFSVPSTTQTGVRG